MPPVMIMLIIQLRRLVVAPVVQPPLLLQPVEQSRWTPMVLELMIQQQHMQTSWVWTTNGITTAILILMGQQHLIGLEKINLRCKQRHRLR